ncbi:GNAT family N-acetyltransferase [bacterium]|nr:GNAT family N-acetyltransferase [bacterium]
MVFRAAGPEDHKILSALSDSIYNSVINKAQYNWPVGSLSAELEKTQTYVSELNGKIVSFICYRDLGDVLEISVLGTLPDQQKMGFQRQLLQQLQVIAAKQRKGLLLEVHQQNERALHLYQQAGFVLLNVRKKYYSDSGDAFVMKWDQQ